MWYFDLKGIECGIWWYFYDDIIVVVFYLDIKLFNRGGSIFNYIFLKCLIDMLKGDNFLLLVSFNMNLVFNK